MKNRAASFYRTELHHFIILYEKNRAALFYRKCIKNEAASYYRTELHHFIVLYLKNFRTCMKIRASPLNKSTVDSRYLEFQGTL